MKVELNTDAQLVQEIRAALKENKGYCPCELEQLPDTKCMCKDFRENVAVGEYCHCGLYKKLSEV
jgi:hypothetical protein